MRHGAIALVVVVAVAAAAAVALPTGGAADEPRVVACEAAAALRFDCFERRYVALVQARGAAAALRDLARERARNGYVRAACHQLTHRAGRAAGVIGGIRAFDDGDPLCSSGFYHGVVEAVMARIGSAHVIERAASVCAELRERERRAADHYNCAHGMGHGFMGSFASDVFASLRGCDALADGWERHACYGGVFMENLSAIGHPTRPPTALRPREPLYPCTAVRRRYREACFDKQTTYALYVTDSDFAEVFALCSRSERAFRGACYRGLGGDIAVDAAKRVVGARAQARSRTRLCLLGPERGARRECVVGVVRVILRDLVGGAAQTTAFCGALGSGDLRRVCDRAREAAYRELPLHDTLLRSAPTDPAVSSTRRAVPQWTNRSSPRGARRKRPLAREGTLCGPVPACFERAGAALRARHNDLAQLHEVSVAGPLLALAAAGFAACGQRRRAVAFRSANCLIPRGLRAVGSRRRDVPGRRSLLRRRRPSRTAGGPWRRATRVRRPAALADALVDNVETGAFVDVARANPLFPGVRLRSRRHWVARLAIETALWEGGAR